MARWRHVSPLIMVNIGADNGLALIRLRDFTPTNADLLLIVSLGTKFRKIGIKIK